MQLCFCILCPHSVIFPYTAICQYTLFIFSDWQNELVSPRKRGRLKRNKNQKKRQKSSVADGLFCLVPWLPVTLLLSLKLEFIFYKLEWNVFVFQVIISILLVAVSIWRNEHIKGCAALTKRCELAGWLDPAFCCKAPAEVTGCQQRAPLHKRAVSAVVDSGQDNRTERWPGLLATCQLVSTTHWSRIAQRSTKGSR